MADQAFSISPPDIRARFEHTHGRDPLFAAFDGANCPNARDGDAAARSLLLRSGLIRVGLPLPANAQFTISVVHDPYGCAIAPDPKGGPRDRLGVPPAAADGEPVLPEHHHVRRTRDARAA